MKKTIILSVSIFILISANLYGQKNIDTQYLLWSRLYIKTKLNNNWRIRQELEERVYWFPWRQHQLLSRTHTERKIGKGWSGAIGLTYFVQSLPHNPESIEYVNRKEIRPQLELTYNQEISEKTDFNHRYWFEFRYIEQDTSGFQFRNNRMRYKFEIRYSPISDVIIKIFDEVHFNIGNNIVHNVFDQNRYGFGINYSPANNLGIELGYFNWFQQLSIGSDFFNRHIIRFTLDYTISFNK